MLNNNLFIQAIDQNYIFSSGKDTDFNSDDDINSQIYKEAEVFLIESLNVVEESEHIKLTNYLEHSWKKQLDYLKNMDYFIGTGK